MRVEQVEATPGSIVRGYIEIGQYPDMPIYSPLMIARGRKEGPTLWLQCLVHGPEVVGPISVARFLKEIDLEELSGSVVALLVANPLGFRAYNRLTPQDGANLNRIFPGKRDGSVSEQIAHRVLGLAMNHADVLVDVHSGGDLTITAFYVIYPKLDSDGSREAQRLASQVGSRYQWGSNEGWLKGAAFSNFTRRTGKPALIVESGGGGRVTDDDLSNFRTALFGVARAMGMLPGKAPTVNDVRSGGNALHIKATRGGFWQPLISPGDDVVSGQEIGRIIDVFGDIAETVTCVFSQAWIGSIRRPWMGVYAGDQVIEIVERTDQ